MRLTLLDVLILNGLFALAVCPACWLLSSHPYAAASWAALGPALALWLGSRLYQKLNFLPLRPPPCPRCNKNDRFSIAENFLDRHSLVCCNCGQLVECWYSPPPVDYQPGSAPEVLSGFPQMVGVYQTIWPGRPSEFQAASPEETTCLVVAPIETDPVEVAIELEENGLEQGEYDPLLERFFPDRNPHLLEVFQGKGALVLRLRRSTERAVDFQHLWAGRELVDLLQRERPDLLIETIDP